MKKSGKIPKQNNLLEPAVLYSTHKPSSAIPEISFATLHKDHEDSLLYQASLSPQERLRNLYQLVCISYGLDSEKLRNPALSNRIIIEDPDEHFS